jgi:hypothetical protein
MFAAMGSCVANFDRQVSIVETGLIVASVTPVG